VSLQAIRAVLETQLATVSGPDYAWENTPYVPVTGTPYAQPVLLATTPANLEMGPAFTEQGIFQVNGFWPKDAGSADATAWAESVRDAFPYATTLSAGGITVDIINTTEIGPARPEDDRFMVPVKVRWSARIGG
jgi:hypothetical protein